MKKHILKTAGIIMVLLCIFSVIMFILTFFSSGGRGVLDLTNVIRYFLAGVAAVSGIAAFALLKLIK